MNEELKAKRLLNSKYIYISWYENRRWRDCDTISIVLSTIIYQINKILSIIYTIKIQRNLIPTAVTLLVN